MAYRIYPNKGAAFNTPLGYDGVDYMAIPLDSDKGDFWSLRVSTPADRAMTRADLNVSTSYDPHAMTQRAVYTVPANKLAVVTNMFVSVTPPTGAGVGYVIIQINTYNVMVMIVDSATPVYCRDKNQGCQTWLIPGNTVAVYTGNTTAESLLFNGVAIIGEFDA